MNRKTIIIFAAVWAVALGLVGFSELRAQNTPESPRQTLSKDSEKTAKGAENSSRPDQGTEATGEKFDAQETKDQKASSSPKKQKAESGVKLKVAGKPGIEFSGRCSVDGKESKLESRTPDTYTYEPEKRLECEISSQGDGALRVTFSDGIGKNSTQKTQQTQQTQQVGPGSSSLELTYTHEGLSLSMRSSSKSDGSSGNSKFNSSQNSSQMSSSQTGGSQVSSSQNSSQTSSSVTQSSGSK